MDNVRCACSLNQTKFFLYTLYLQEKYSFFLINYHLIKQAYLKKEKNTDKSIEF